MGNERGRIGEFSNYQIIKLGGDDERAAGKPALRDVGSFARSTRGMREYGSKMTNRKSKICGYWPENGLASDLLYTTHIVAVHS